MEQLALAERGGLLTGREAEILSLVARGERSKDVADKLFLAKCTVDYHLACTYKKLGVSNRIQAIVVASRLGIITAEFTDSMTASWRSELQSELVPHCPEPHYEKPVSNGTSQDAGPQRDGQLYGVSGSLIGLDSKYVDNDNGRLVAKSSAQKDNLKYVGYGAGGGALVALLTDGNVLSNSLIGAALGFLYGEIQKDPSKANNVALDQGSLFGVRLTNDLAVRIPNNGSK